MALEIPLVTSATNSLSTLTGPISDALGGFDLSALGSDVLGEGLGIGLFKPARSIGTIVPEVTIEEQGRDDLEITRHPIETGAPITDHAFKLPAEVIVRCGWSESGSLPGFSKAAYENLLALQFTREPFTLVTGKRTYHNMLIASIAQQTDARTEHALLATVVLRQIIIVTATTTDVGPRATQANPQATAATENGGTRQATSEGSTTATPASTTQQPGAMTRFWNMVTGWWSG